jgi:hypothetical protein
MNAPLNENPTEPRPEWGSGLDEIEKFESRPACRTFFGGVVDVQQAASLLIHGKKIRTSAGRRPAVHFSEENHL